MNKQFDRLPSASVVIPTWNAASFVARVLDRLVAQVDMDFEILVVDNGVINPETEQVCIRYKKQFPKLRYLSFKKQLGYAGAVNEGTKAAAHDLVAVLNNDNLPEPDWLVELVRCWEREKSTGFDVLVSSLVDRPDFPKPQSAALNIFGRYVYPDPAWSRDPFHADGSAFLFDRKSYDLPYESGYFIYHEDVYLGWRARLMGNAVRFAVKSRAKTFDGGSTRRIAYKTAFYTERNRWLNYFLFLSGVSLLKLMPILLLDALVKMIFGSNRRAKAHAWSWLLTHPHVIWGRRVRIQVTRRKGDEEILPYFSACYLTPTGVLSRIVNFLVEFYCKLMGIKLT
jgi:GT2 family glycosyltransferase